MRRTYPDKPVLLVTSRHDAGRERLLRRTGFDGPKSSTVLAARATPNAGRPRHRTHPTDGDDTKPMRARWLEVTGRPVPRVRRTLLRLALAWELQAAVYGGISRRAEQRLAYLAGKAAPETTAAPGTRLLREWNGVLHTVTIAEDGAICWDDRTWRSLSEVARVITGTRWSGPVFFGLRTRKAAA